MRREALPSVSTLEYFIHSSRLDRDAALAGMPYSFQGLRLNHDGAVEKLWAGSPVDQAGVQLGDILWSVEKNALRPTLKNWKRIWMDYSRALTTCSLPAARISPKPKTTWPLNGPVS